MNLEAKTAKRVNIGDRIIFCPENRSDSSRINPVLKGMMKVQYAKQGLKIGKDYRIENITPTEYLCKGIQIPNVLFEIKVNGKFIKLGCGLFSESYIKTT